MHSEFVGQSINMLSQFRNQVSMLKGKFRLFVYITFMAEKSRMKSRPMFYLLLFFTVKSIYPLKGEKAANDYLEIGFAKIIWQK